MTAGFRTGTPVTGSVPLVAAAPSRDPRTALLREHVATMVSATVGDALGEVPPPDRERAHVVLAAHDYAALAVREFVAARRDPAQRLRAVHSIALETSRLLRPLTVGEAGMPDVAWLGHGVVLTTPGGGEQALRAAGAAVAAGRAPAAVAAGVRVVSGGAGGTEVHARVTPVLRAVVTA